MTFDEARLSLQLMAEEAIGAPMRAAAQERRSREDASWAAVTRKARR